MNLKSEKKDANIEHASLKTIAAFLNSGGGVLLIGVDDKSGIVGIETDDFDNVDRFSLHFWNLVKTAVGQDISAFLQTCFETVEGKTVFIVRCSKSTRPVFLKQSVFGEEFYIRVGPSSAKLDISEALKYINERFDKI
jgi:predicted HTH transcriptional regulator